MTLSPIAERILDKLADHEDSISELYALYSAKNSELGDFWYRMAQEERGHARLVLALKAKIEKGEARLAVGAIDAGQLQAASVAVRAEMEAVKDRETLSSAVALARATAIERSLVEREFYKIATSDSSAVEQFKQGMQVSITSHQKRLYDALGEETRSAAESILKEASPAEPSPLPEGDTLTWLMRHEDAMGQLYALFAEKLPSDEAFWSRLSKEETGHSGVLHRLGEWAATQNLPLDLSRVDLVELHTSLTFMADCERCFASREASVEEALLIARFLELSILENEFLDVAENAPTELKRDFDALRRHTEEHLRRIDERIEQV